MADQQIDELKELVRQQTAIIKEMHSLVKSMHRASVWRTTLKFIWIGIIVAISFGAYIYLQPYLEQVMQLYQAAAGTLEQARQFGSQFQ